MKRIAILVALTFLIVLVPAKLAIAANGFSVVPSAFDPYGTHLVAAEWEAGIGCATNANTTTDGIHFTLYSDPACLTGDPSGDTRVEGLLLAKTRGTNYAAAGATIEGVSGIGAAVDVVTQKNLNGSADRIPGQVSVNHGEHLL